MEFEKLSKQELRAQTASQGREIEYGIRDSLAKIRMDIFSEKGKHTGRVRQLKKNLARVLTFEREAKLKAKETPKA